MNEDHIIAAILTAGLVAKSKDEELHPKDVVGIYQLTLTELIASLRPPRDTATK